ncbi:hypothetical protein EDB86DRAFT_2805407, partial [Lactarius hatsudake]
RDIMHDNMLVNVSGLTGHVMPIDLNIEHLIGELKKLSQAKGLNLTWDHLGNILATVDIIKKLKKCASVAMKTAYQGAIHMDPKTDHLVWYIAKKGTKNNCTCMKKTDLEMQRPKLCPTSLLWVKRSYCCCC